MWMLVLMTTLLVLFGMLQYNDVIIIIMIFTAYIPNKIGELVASRIFAWNSVSNRRLQSLHYYD